MRGDNVMGGRVGGGGWPAHSLREGKRVSPEHTEGQVKEHRAGVWSELEYAVAHSRQTPKIEPLCSFLLLLLGEESHRLHKGNFTTRQKRGRSRGSFQ